MTLKCLFKHNIYGKFTRITHLDNFFEQMLNLSFEKHTYTNADLDYKQIICA